MSRASSDDRVDVLYREHGVRVLAYLARRVHDPDVAADLLSEVAITLWRRHQDLPPPGQDVLWFFGIARHVLANHQRRTVRHRELSERLAEELRAIPSRTTDPDATIDVRHAIDRLDPLDQEIVRLSAWEGLTSVEIGTLLEMPPDTVRSRLRRARARLSRELVPDADAQPVGAG